MIGICEGDPFGSGLFAVNPNWRIPKLLDRRGSKLARSGDSTSAIEVSPLVGTASIQARWLERVFDIGMQACPNCGIGGLKTIATMLAFAI